MTLHRPCLRTPQTRVQGVLLPARALLVAHPPPTSPFMPVVAWPPWLSCAVALLYTAYNAPTLSCTACTLLASVMARVAAGTQGAMPCARAGLVALAVCCTPSSSSRTPVVWPRCIGRSGWLAHARVGGAGRLASLLLRQFCGPAMLQWYVCVCVSCAEERMPSLGRPTFLTSSSGARCGRPIRHNERAPACWRDAQLCGSVAAHSRGPVLFPPH